MIVSRDLTSSSLPWVSCTATMSQEWARSRTVWCLALLTLGLADMEAKNPCEFQLATLNREPAQNSKRAVAPCTGFRKSNACKPPGSASPQGAPAKSECLALNPLPKNQRALHSKAPHSNTE